MRRESERSFLTCIWPPDALWVISGLDIHTYKCTFTHTHIHTRRSSFGFPAETRSFPGWVDQRVNLTPDSLCFTHWNSPRKQTRLYSHKHTQTRVKTHGYLAQITLTDICVWSYTHTEFIRRFMCKNDPPLSQELKKNWYMCRIYENMENI